MVEQPIKIHHHISPVSHDGPMRILQVTGRYAPLTGGTETHVKEVSKRLAANGHRVTVLTTDPSKSLPSEEIVDGVRIVRIPAWPSHKDYNFAPGLRSVIANGQWDIIHLQGYHTLVAPLAISAALRSGIPYVVSFHSGGHSSRIRTMARGAQRRLLAPGLKRASRLIPVSQFEAKLFGATLALPPDHFTVIPNGSDLSWPRKLIPATTMEDSPLIVSVGRAEKYKGHHRLIMALPYLRKTHRNARLRIVGDGVYAPTLRQLAAEMNLSDAVKVEGIPSKDRMGMARLLSQASVVALLSDYEAHPVALVEALSLGKKILAADNSGMSELAAFPHVRTIALPCSSEDIASAIAERIGAPHPEGGYDLPTWDTCARSLEQLYRDVLLRHRSSGQTPSPVARYG